MTTKERNRLYEGMYIINSSLSEDARNTALKKITDSIEEKKGEVHKIHSMGKRKLAYEINRKREGFYYLIYFSVKSSLIDEIWKEYHLNEDLIRFTTLRASEIRETLEFKPLMEEN